MAKLITDKITITLSKMVPSHSTDEPTLLSEEIVASIEAVIAELVGNSVMVEIE